MIRKHRWAPEDDLFAQRFTKSEDELKGLLRDSVVIEPGVVAYVIHEGQEIGNILPGEFTLTSLDEKFEFWRKGQTTLVLTRSDMLPIDVSVEGLWTLDSLRIDAKSRFKVQVSDVGRFIWNVLGAADSFSTSDLQAAIEPLIRQQFSQAVAARSHDELFGPNATAVVQKTVASQVNEDLGRYGLKFIAVETVVLESGAVSEIAGINEEVQVRASRRKAALSDRLDRVNKEFEFRRQSILSEIKMAELVATKENNEWKRELERELNEVDQHHQIKTAKLKSYWERIKTNRESTQDEEWEALIHRQRVETVREEVELAERQRKRRVALLEQETANELDRRQIEQEQARQDFELESSAKVTDNQLDRLRKVQELNLEMQERAEKSKLDLEESKEAGVHRREIERIQLMSDMDSDALIATTHSENAKQLADLKKHEASARLDESHSKELDEERKEMYAKLNESERRQAEAIANAFREATSNQQQSVEKMIDGLARTSSNPQANPRTPPVPVPETTWFIAEEGQESGPFDNCQMEQLVNDGRLSAESYVYRQGMSDWTIAAKVPELARFLGETQTWRPPTPPPKS